MKPTRLHLAMAVVCALSACQSSDTTGPGNNGGNGTSKFKAVIDGAAWNSNAGVETTGVPVTLPGLYVLTGTQLGGAAAYTVVLNLYNIGGPGTYALGVGPNVPGGTAQVSNISGGWVTAQSGADGEVFITALTDTRITGSFQFTANALTGSATGTKAVTLGTFDVPVHWTGPVVALPANKGSKVTALVGQTSWNAAFVSSQLASSIFTMSSTNSSGGIGISLTGVTGPGFYPLSPSNVLSFSKSPNPLANTWNSTGAGSSGSVTIASVTASRIQGTFTGTLGPAPSTTTTGTVTVNGTFDLGRGP